MRRIVLIILVTVMIGSLLGIAVIRLVREACQASPPPLGQLQSANFLIKVGGGPNYVSYGDAMAIDPVDREPFLAALKADLAAQSVRRSRKHAPDEELMLCVFETGSLGREFCVVGDNELHDLHYRVFWRADCSAPFIRKYHDRYRELQVEQFGREAK
jgi:hypothetical protein